MSEGISDFCLFLVANIYNLLMVVIFLSRTFHRPRIEHYLGLVAVSMTIPLAIIMAFNGLTGRNLWLVFLPLPLLIFLVIEWLLDFRLKLDFRSTRLLGPYLLFYYLGLFGMIGYTFMVSKVYGFITLGSYFLNLVATFYSYRRVGHGAHQ